MNDELDVMVRCAGEALCAQYNLVNNDSFIGILDINDIQNLMEPVYKYIAEFLRDCNDDEFAEFFKELDNYIKENDLYGYLTGDSGPGRRERGFVIEGLEEEMNARL